MQEAWTPAPLDDLAPVPGVKGVMLTFDDFLAGMDNFENASCR